MNYTNSTIEKNEINLYYVTCEVLVAVVAVVGNSLVIFVFKKERRLRRRTNYYIVSLAVADLLVGLLGIPFAIMSSIGLPRNLHACLFTVSLLVVLCTISIFCLVAVSVDRYWAILHPMGYSRNVRTKTALVIIGMCWLAGSILGFLPLMGWHKIYSPNSECFFLDVMEYNYLVFLYFGTIISPAILLAAFYAHIYQVVLQQIRRIATMGPERGVLSNSCRSGGSMLRMLGAAQKREVKATQNLAIIVLFFMLCWIPLYTINCVLAFCETCSVDPTFMLCCIILSHLNSAGNPLLYAYNLRDFRAALKNLLSEMFCSKIEPKFTERGFVSRSNCNNSRISSRGVIRQDYKSGVSLGTKMKGNVNPDLWNIAEGSSSSNDSLKQVKTCNGNETVDQTKTDSTNVDGQTKIAAPIKTLSNCSPQMSDKNLFFIEAFAEKDKWKEICETKESNPLKVMNIFINKRRIGKSVSDQGTAFSESVTTKYNGDNVRNSVSN